MATLIYRSGLIGAAIGLGDIPSWIGIVAGLIAFCFSLYQYRQAQLWKRAEFLASEMGKMFSDRKVATALLLLDYSRIKLKPDGTRADRNEKGFVFDDALCESDLRNHGEFADEGWGRSAGRSDRTIERCYLI